MKRLIEEDKRQKGKENRNETEKRRKKMEGEDRWKS
jgi:hypothetical protein